MTQLINTNSILEKELRYLLFALNDKKYAVDIAHVVEIIKLTELDYPQKLPFFLCGLLQYKHLTINIVNTAKILELEQKEFDIDSQILILKTDESILGFIVDKVYDLITIPQGNVHLRPYNSANNIIKFITYFDNEMIFIFDLYSVEKYIKLNEKTYSSEIGHSLFPTDENSKKILKERKQHLLEKEEYSIPWAFAETDEYIWFKINSHNYCLNIASIKEIVKLNLENITSVPCTPDFIRGIISHHGEFFTVVDISLFLGESPVVLDTDFCKLIIINDSDFKVAFLVNEVHNILKLSANDILINQNDDYAANYCPEEFVKNSQLFRILNLRTFLTDKRLFVYENA